MHHPAVERLFKYLPGIMARYYNCEFYLVGSAQTNSNPRDIDIIVKVPDDLFHCMYGNYGTLKETIENWSIAIDKWDFSSNVWKLWAKDISKQGRELTMFVGRQVDFKTQPASYFETINKTRTLIPSVF